MSLTLLIIIALLVLLLRVAVDIKGKQQDLDVFSIDAVNEADGRFVSIRDSVVDTDMPMLKVKVQGKDYYFLVDSGANCNVVSPEVINSCTEGQISIVKGELNSTGGITDSYITDLTFECGGDTFTEQFQIIMDDSSFRRATEGSAIKMHGIIGSSFMRKHRWHIDFDSLVVWKKSKQ